MLRRIRRILMFLILGVVTTVGVAWGLAVIVVADPKSSEVPGVPVFGHCLIDQQDDRVAHFKARAGSGFLWLDGLGVNRLSETLSELDRFGQGLTPRFLEAANFHVPSWSTLHDRNTIDQLSKRSMSRSADRAFGWPFLSAVASLTFHRNWLGHSETRCRSGILVRDGESPAENQIITGLVPRPLEPVVLPLRPILPGFLINTLFYAAIWFGLFAGWGALKRARRRRRGLCPDCAYDLRGHNMKNPHPNPLPEGAGVRIGCPECGWNRGLTPRTGSGDSHAHVRCHP